MFRPHTTPAARTPRRPQPQSLLLRMPPRPSRHRARALCRTLRTVTRARARTPSMDTRTFRNTMARRKALHTSISISSSISSTLTSINSIIRGSR